MMTETTPAGSQQNDESLGVADITNGSPQIPQDYNRIGDEYSLSAFDRPHRLAVNYIYEVPGPKRGILKQLLGGWQLSGVTQGQSGQPFTARNTHCSAAGITGRRAPAIEPPSSASPATTRTITALCLRLQEGRDLLDQVPRLGEPESGGDAKIAEAVKSERRSAQEERVGLAPGTEEELRPPTEGGADEGPPGIREPYHPNYYGAYVRDLDGNKLCVVCHKPAAAIAAE